MTSAADPIRAAPGWRDALPEPRRAARPTRDRVEGMLFGLAIGDSLGQGSEGELPAKRFARLGEVRDFLPSRHAGGRAVGVPSDDTQLAFRLLHSLLENGGRVEPERLAAKLLDGPIFGIGQTIQAFAEAHRPCAPWWEAAQESAGNGALMRVAPVVLPHLAHPATALYEEALLSGAVTHNDFTSNGACAAFAGILLDLLGRRGRPEPEWWLDEYVRVARPIEGETALVPRRPGLDYRGPLWRFVDTEVRSAVRAKVRAVEACDRWYSGAFLLETVPCVLLLLALHGADPEEAIVRAANDTKDNDTIAAIVGACAGALHGRSALPRRWLDNLLGRTGASDDGQVHRLVEEACRRWAPE